MEKLEHQRSYLLRLPLSLRRQAADMALEEGISLNQFISLAVSHFVLEIERDRQRRATPMATTPQK